MFAILAFVLFILSATGIENLGPLATLPLGLACLAIALLWPWHPFNR